MVVLNRGNKGVPEFQSSEMEFACCKNFLIYLCVTYPGCRAAIHRYFGVNLLVDILFDLAFTSLRRQCIHPICTVLCETLE